MLLRRWLIAGAMALALTCLSPTARAVTTTTTALSTSSYTDLGAGPMQLSVVGGAAVYEIADSQPSAVALGFSVQQGQPAQSISSSSHVWARAIGVGAISAVIAPISSASGGSGGGAVTLNSTPSLANGNGVVPTQGGAALSATNGAFTNLLQGNAALSAANPIFFNPGTGAVFSISATALPLPTGAATAANQTATQGPVAPGTAAANSNLTGCVYNATPPTLTDGKQVADQCDANGHRQIVIFGATFNNNGQQPMTGGAPVTIASDQSTLPVASQASATGGQSTTGNIAANNTTAVVVKGSAGTLYGAQLYGIGSAPAYLKIYNATSATCGSGTPVKRLMIPAASTAANGAGSNITFGPQGIALGTGITYCVTTGIADADTTAPAASTFLVNFDWK